MPLLDSKDYVEYDGQQCPNCRRTSLHSKNEQYDGGEIVVEMECLQCQSTWTEHYILKGYTELVVGENYQELVKIAKETLDMWRIEGVCMDEEVSDHLFYGMERVLKSLGAI